MSVYSALVIADAPYHYWRCNDGGGGYIQDVHAVTPRPLIAQGQQIGLGYSGPVSDGGSAMTDANFGFAYYDTEALATPFSCEFWFWQAYYQGLVQRLVTINNAAGADACTFQTSAVGLLTLFSAGGGTSSLANLAASRWHHAVGTFDGTNERLYLDGVLQSTRASGAVVTPVRYIMGTASANANPMAGSLSEIALYASVLTAGQVLAHFNAADRVGVNPTNQSQQTGGGSPLPPPFGPSIDAILAAVRKTYG